MKQHLQCQYGAKILVMTCVVLVSACMGDNTNPANSAMQTQSPAMGNPSNVLLPENAVVQTREVSIRRCAPDALAVKDAVKACNQ